MAKLTRRELYDLVWSKPMTKLAAEFGLSDVGLAKICKKHRVPTPTRGYWARKEAGQKVKQATFVEVGDPRIDNIQITDHTTDLPEPVRAVVEQRRAERKISERKPRKQTAAPMPVEPVEKPHPAIVATAKALRRSTRGTSVAEAKGEDMCGIAVAPECVERVIAILDRLARACEQRAMVFAPTGSGMSATIGRDTVSFTLIERTRQVPHVLTPAEIAEDEKRLKRQERRNWRRDSWDDVLDFAPYRPKHDIVRTGELVFEVQSWGQGLRRQWRDAKTQTIETLLPDIVDGIETHIVSVRVRREEQERAEAVRRDLERRRALAKARKQREADREAVLANQMDLVRRARDLREWIGANQRMAVAAEPELRRMLAWAKEQLADVERQLDPETLAADLQERKLFPEVDELHDPKGEPPSETRWW